MAQRSNYLPMKLEDDDSEQSESSLYQRRRWFNSTWLLYLNSLILLISLICLGAAYKLSHRTYDWHLRQTTAYSPFFDKIDLKDPVNRFEFNELFNHPYTIYRGPPSKEVDDAWEEISDVGIVLIDEDDVTRLGKDPSQTVKAPEHWGHGTRAHLAQIDGMHQIHCLNVLRKWSHYDHYFRPHLGDNPGIIQTSHRDHCLMLILQTLTCQPSLDVITHNWMATQQYPVPDFNMNRKCKSYDKVKDWQQRNRITMEQWDEIAPKEGDFILPLWPELVEINRQNGLNMTR